MLGNDRGAAIIDEHREAAAGDIPTELCATLKRFARGAPQEDDLTAILVQRPASCAVAQALAPASRARPGSRLPPPGVLRPAGRHRKVEVAARAPEHTR